MINGLSQLSPLAQAGIRNALAGKPMTAAEDKAVQAAIGNATLSPTLKGSLASALQTDQQIKTVNNVLNGLATGTVLSSLSGLSSLGGGLLNGASTGALLGSPGVGGGGAGSGYPSSADGGDSAPLVSGDPVGSTMTPYSTDATEEESAASAADEDGVALLAVSEGAAAEQAGLRAGDVILSFDGVRTRSFEALRQAVQQADGPVRVVFINSENNQTEYLTVEPRDGAIGVTCER